MNHPDYTQLHLDVAFGRSGGRIIWQPRILAWFADKEFAGEPLPAPYTGMTPAQLYRALGCSNRLYDFDQCFVSHEDERVRITQQDINETDYAIVWETPVGRQRAIYRRSPNTWHHAPVKWPIADAHDLKVAAWREERRTWSWDQGAFDPLDTIESHVVWDAIGRWNMSDSVSTYVKVDNLFDEVYVASRRPAGVRPGLERTAYVGVTLRL